MCRSVPSPIAASKVLSSFCRTSFEVTDLLTSFRKAIEFPETSTQFRSKKNPL